MKEAPCIGCERRRFDCHPGCEEYNAWLAGRQEIAKIREKEKAATPELPRKVIVQIWRGMIRRRP